MVDEKSFRKEIREAYNEGRPRTRIYLAAIAVVLILAALFLAAGSVKDTQLSGSGREDSLEGRAGIRESMENNVAAIQKIRDDLEKFNITIDENDTRTSL